ncbi:MFS transporter [Anaerobacillus isosaccharinicus]|uniref:MFS transporter n=1 Tax=Anaerobacillus isosaccharinicus TaxID=1532552 RepID=A0A1S2LIX3_9BACI|nr:MFS transporter [Anaerobacillus isosaccharinicus]MBA5588329.1 MFS transporter [Anaerobacillus isosaccharinicus]QOY38236.1 MFS transporter [Anaerobacillus isosaccharinicus]
MKIEKGNDKSSRQIIVTALVTALCLIGDSMLYIALPIYYKGVGLQSLWEVGLILSLNRLVRIPLNPMIGWLYRVLTIRTGILVSIVLAVITTVGYGFVQGLVGWIILRVLWGIAWSFLRFGGFLTVIECSNEFNRGKLMGTYNGLLRLGFLVGMLGGGVLVSIFGFNSIAIFFGVLMLIGIPLVLLTVPSKKAEEKREPLNDRFVTIFTRSVIVVLCSGLLLAFIIQGMFTSTISLVMSYHFGEQIDLLGLTVGVTALAGILQGIRWLWEPILTVKVGSLSDGEKGRAPLLILFLVCAAIPLIVIPISTPIYLWLASSLIFMAAGTLVTTLVDTLATDVAKHNAHTNAVITYYTVCVDIGAALGPLVVYLVMSIENGILLTYCFGSFILLLLALFWSKENTNILENKLQIRN